MITIPDRLKTKLEKNPALCGAVYSSLSKLNPWFSDNKTVFFPEYTDHGITHLQEVINTADSLITDESWPSITANDAAAIITSTLLHDCAMHLSEDGFYSLINKKYPPGKSRYFENDIDWSHAWHEFFAEAKRFDGKKLRSLFGDDTPVRDIPLNKLDLNLRDKLLIGEFLRRHHATLAHHIALNGIPGPSESRVRLEGFDNDILDLFGFIARSHNMGLRSAIDLLEQSKRRVHYNTHVPFIMAVLRISDYIQIHSTRAENQLLEIKSLSSPISKKEWKKHNAIKEINQTHDDPEALYIDAEPQDAIVYESLSALFKDIQKELDVTWSILGEVYGRMDSLKNIGINIRRVRSSLDSTSVFIKDKKPNFIPKTLKLKTSDSEMINLLIAPLYGNSPGVGIRELMQNAVDACNELIDYYYKKAEREISSNNIDVTIKLIKTGDKNTLIISDHGIGMTLSVIENYFLNIGASFRKSDSWKSIHERDGQSSVHRTGRFGIGLLAAYLLGDEIHVKTRHVTDQTGYEFSCRQDSDAICVKPIDFRIGTEISIIINDKVFKDLTNSDNYSNEDYWDWYCLPHPKVNRLICNESEEVILEQSITVPMNEEDLSDTPWNRTHHPEFNDIIWGYVELRERRNRSTNLICNGIKVLRSNHFYNINLSTNRHDMNANYPTLIVYDQDGRMPLNLQRDSLTTRDLQFKDELMKDLSEYLSKIIISKFENEDRKINEELIKKLIMPGIDILVNNNAADDGFPQLIIFNEKLLPLNACLIKELKPKMVSIDFVVLSDKLGSWQSQTLMDSVECYIPYHSRRGSKISKINFLRGILDDNSYRSGYFKTFPTIGKRIFIRKAEIDELVSPNNYPRTSWARLKTEWENKEWKILSIGNVPPINEKIARVINELSRVEQPFYIEVYLDWDKADGIDDSSIFSTVWKETAQGILI
ncbi:HD domain-containing protein [Serratia marcescens]|uniref:HD domain-containing protein n=1 Tax=Serratia marcescens TaxID=615 RepID=UPI003ED896FA